MIRITRRLGCRISETLNLGIEDIDFDRSWVTILHQKARILISCPACGARLKKGDKYCPSCAGKVESVVQKAVANKKVRTIPIDKDTLEMVRIYIAGSQLVRVNGKRRLFNLTRSRAWQIFVETAVRAGLPKIMNPETGKVHNVSPHKLRDAFAVNAIKKDNTTDGARLLQELLGHKDIGTTMRYRKIAGEELQAYYDKLFEEGK
jgi:integrase/recombinase XerD